MANHPFLQLSPDQVTPELKAIFNQADPASLRCSAVLDNHAAGRVFTDHPESPTWAVLQEAAFGSLYLAGMLSQSILHQLVNDLRFEGDVLVGLWQDDPRWSFLPLDPKYVGYTLEYFDRNPDIPLPGVPAGCQLRRLDASLTKQILDRNLLIRMYGSIQQALEWGYGLCLLHGDELLCEAFAGPAANGIIEIGVETNPHHMQQGYATITCMHLIQRMEQQGYSTYWNCASQNQASIALAHRLGYQTEKQYRLLAWFKI
jgi:GNAT acetyltransferase